MKVLVTGGLGYIGSHICVELLSEGHDVIIADNLSNSIIDVKSKIEKIANKKVAFYKIDLCDKAKTEKIFEENKIDVVIHCAALKAVGESVDEPLKYYRNNLVSTIVLLECMDKFDVNMFIFSSSATVYGASKTMPLTEESAIGATNPYGQTKIMIEQIIEDYAVAHKNFKGIILRYFNPIGAHSSGLIGESPKGIPNNIMPFIMQVASGKLKELKIFGDDYDTTDGTGVRDYIHIVDLAKGHTKALEFFKKQKNGVEIFNLGTGKGYSVLELVKEYNKICDNKVKYSIVGRRNGDVAIVFCSPKKANDVMGWKATKTLEDMCKSCYNFAQKNL
jgi:UDP-glucose 4-epimerase